MFHFCFSKVFRDFFFRFCYSVNSLQGMMYLYAVLLGFYVGIYIESNLRFTSECKYISIFCEFIQAQNAHPVLEVWLIANYTDYIIQQSSSLVVSSFLNRISDTSRDLLMQNLCGMNTVKFSVRLYQIYATFYIIPSGTLKSVMKLNAYNF